MLGRTRKTTRLDVGLALAFAGIAYLIWALVAGVSRATVVAMIRFTEAGEYDLPEFTRGVKIFFADLGFIIDVVGLAWLGGSLVLLLFSSRQRFSISWVWACALGQTGVAALGAALVGWAAYQPHMLAMPADYDPSIAEQISRLSLPIIIGIAVVLWLAFLVYLLVDRARYGRRGPTLRDGLRTNLYR